MRRKLILLFFGFIIYSSSFSQIYITNVTVIDVLKHTLIGGQTVTIQNGIIANIQPSAKTKMAANAVTIDGSGKYLMPGMTDAHVHFFQSGGLYTRPDAINLNKYQPYAKEIEWVHTNMEDFLRRYIQCGITSVIDVGATYNFLQQRDSFQNKTYAPNIYMTGPLLTSYEPPAFANLKNDRPFILVKTIEDGVSEVDSELQFHPDFIKIWYIVSQNKDSVEASARRFEPVAKAIIDEAHRHHLKVAVHATERITAQLAVESGCDYLVHGVEDEIVNNDFIQLLKSKKVIDCPTLIVEDGYIKSLGQISQYTKYDLAASNPKQIGSIEDLKHLPDTLLAGMYKRQLGMPVMMKRWHHSDSVRMVNLKKMIDGGVTIAAGTDAGNIGTQHASSFYDELLAMKESGLSNWQIIESATIDPAKILDHQDSLGSIAVGKKADLVLLNANPVAHLENIININLVINKGQVIKPDTLIAMTPETLVQQQVNAYNVGNMDAFLAPYADDAELYTFPDKLIAKGKDQMRKQYAGMFTSMPGLHCEIKGRIIQGNHIIDKESISIAGKGKMEGTAVYEIENNKIKKVYFIE